MTRSFTDCAISEIFPLLYQELTEFLYPFFFFYINFCCCHLYRKLVFTQEKHLLYCSGMNESGIKQAEYVIVLIRACVSELCQHLMVLLSWHALTFCKESLYLMAPLEKNWQEGPRWHGLGLYLHNSFVNMSKGSQHLN